jgi:hypothetical protein
MAEEAERKIEAGLLGGGLSAGPPERYFPDMTMEWLGRRGKKQPALPCPP